MKLMTYTVDGRERLGFLSTDGQWVIPLDAAGMEYRTMEEMICDIGEPEILLMGHIAGQSPSDIRGAIPLGEVKLLPPIPIPRHDIICLGVNYMEHARESEAYHHETPDGERTHAVYFSKRVDRAVGHEGEIPGHWGIVDSLDYEAELAVIIGKDAWQVERELAGDYIFGYTILNDVSARNLQSRHGQWYFGKSLDGFAPMGPWIVTADEFSYPPVLSIQSRVNGELRQDSDTGQQIFDIGWVISELSKGMTLKAGTIISTGTPAGVGLGFTPPRFLKSGDVVECSVERIGVLRNTVR